MLKQLLKRLLYPERAKHEELQRIRAERCRPWFEIRGDETLRLDYELDESSVVFDLGGYEGEWSAQIDERYRPQIYVFEPVERFYRRIRQRFQGRENIRPFAFGLGRQTADLTIHVSADSSSVFDQARGEEAEEIRVVNAVEFLEEHQIRHIDLMKINIEGGEYDLLEHLLDCGWSEKIRNIQVQFHDFVPDAEARMRAIQDRLQRTHRPTYRFVFVWENWQLR